MLTHPLLKDYPFAKVDKGVNSSFLQMIPLDPYNQHACWLFRSVEQEFQGYIMSLQ
jgi:hypothetical protein